MRSKKQWKNFSSLKEKLMRLTVLSCCVLLLGLIPQFSYAQTQSVEITENKTVTVDEVFDIIKKQTDYKFIYKANLFKGMPKVALKKGKTTVKELLEKAVSADKFKISTRGNSLIIRVLPPPPPIIPENKRNQLSEDK